MTNHNGETHGTTWLVLIHQIPQEPASLRMKIWRRLQNVGAVAIKNSMYVLPMNEQTQEDFEWILRELTASGADGAILESKFLDGMTDQQIQALFDNARDADYAALGNDVRAFTAGLPKTFKKVPDRLKDARNQLTKFKKKLAEIEAIDFFGANGREAAEGLVNTLAEKVAPETGARETGGNKMQDVQVDELKGRVWVTRRNVYVDRIASAWLIRRWIDANAVFKFTSNKNYAPSAREIRFDMFEAEFTHEGDKCTFEVLAEKIAPNDAALKYIAEIIHDIDLKDQKFDREETPGIANLLTGITAGLEDDDQRIERGSAMFDDLYRSLRETKK
ncbi:MAG: chromate resistance protein [Gammaproteobacteria bacterium]|nr:chromate resistance protein [Gammaproteobacteria bacterium]